ncbi:MAG TPA: YhcH/YjgK/YiaL family protein [Pirellulales bacterium]|jgi:YhcH/YjgK/YiaL family protein
MVFDQLENAAQYVSLHPRLASAFDYLRSTNPAQLSIGRHDIAGDDIFALVQEYRTRSDVEGFWESHRRYIDVQFVASGAERMGYANIEKLEVRQAYDADKDLLIYDGQGDFFVVPAGMFTIFKPQDAHMPCLSPGEPTTVRKIVIKVAV